MGTSRVGPSGFNSASAVSTNFVFLEERVEQMKPQFSGIDDGPMPDSTLVPSPSGASAVPSKRTRARRAKSPARKTALGHAHALSDDQHAHGLMAEKYYTVEEVADILNVSPRTVRRWVRTKVLKSYKFGVARRIASSGLQALIARSCDI
ncbi:helix-turn-helix domain-containing protein [Methylocapsa sp. D3K7]|uniref:helix-turn-helix domain-containing protein n=1 Tax=Methylocapsa sp. D3K7 TaxID=3041435 RepID=UPI00244EDE75|nr:helix-turn-helix domain-containing protein [Methylocapsa sp. D3K7]WGJ14155.1 helix-turn-helix domain-containing protein [Methylocapsa sp. D3K7]